MNRARFDNRAKWLSANWRTKKGQAEVLPTTMTPAEFWKTSVKSKEDVVTYYQLYYPQLGDQLSKALAE